MDFGVGVARRLVRRMGVRRLAVAGLSGAAALGVAVGVLTMDLGAQAQTGLGYTDASYNGSDLPGFRLSVQPSLVAPDSNDLGTVYGTPTSPGAAAPSARITALAHALENNPTRIYQFVYNTILFEPQFGLHKGADGVLLDGSGGSFDQAQLMVEMLRVSGYSARYVLGTVNLSGTEAKSILRVENAKQACLLLAAAGTPATVNGMTNCGDMVGDVTGVTMMHLWVEANIAGSWYAFDPSLKLNNKVTGINLWQAAGASSAASAWSNVSSGVSISGGNLNGLNAASINGKLNTYADTLQDALMTDAHSGKSLRELTGGWEIQRTEAGPRVAQIARQASVATRWSEDIPAPYRATLNIKAEGFNHTFDLPSIYGWRTQAQIQTRRLVVAVRKEEHLHPEATAYFAGGNGGESNACGTANVICGDQPTETAFNAADRAVTLTINHPYAGRRTGLQTLPPNTNQPWPAGTFADESVIKHLEVGKRADILVRTAGGNGGRRAQWASANDPIQMHRIIPAGNPYECFTNGGDEQTQAENCDETQDSDWTYWVQNSWWLNPRPGLRRFPVGEVAAAEMGMKKDQVLNAWGDMFDNTVRMMEPLSGARIFHQHSIGVSLTPSYVENVLDLDTSVAIAAGGSDHPHHILSALASLSVAEEAMALGQTATERPMFSGSSIQATAASRLAVGSGLKVLTATGSTTTLPSDVSADTKAQIETYLAKGYSVLTTTGAMQNAFLARRNDGSEQAWIMRAQAAASSQPDVDPRVYFLKGAATETPNPIDYLGKAEARQIAANVAGTHLGAVDLRSGTLSFSEGTEITVGQGEFPYSLGFSRSYSSTGPVEGLGALGMGWTHNWESSVSRSSDFTVLFPQADTVSAAPTIIAVLTALQAGRADTLEAAAVSGVATNWLQQQIDANVITVNGGGQSGRFVRLIDGSWRNPNGPTEQLTVGQVSGNWTYDWMLADRSTMAFRTVVNDWDGEPSLPRHGTLTTWTFPTGVVINLAYTGGDDANLPLLTTVSNNLGATLTFQNLKAPTKNGTKACNDALVGATYPDNRVGQQQCYNASQQSGRLLRVSGGQDQVNFTYWTRCTINVNYCAFILTGASRPGLRARTYVYGTPTGALSGYIEPEHYQQVLTQVNDEGITTPRARFDWRAVGGQVAPYVTESFDAQNRKTRYYASTLTLSSAADAEGGFVRQAYDEDGRLIVSSDALGRAARAEYDGPGRTVAIKTPWGDTTRFGFDRWGDLRWREQTPIANCAAGYTTTQEIQWAANWWCPTIRVEADYDPVWHRPTAIRLPATAADPVQRQWTLNYNAKGLVDVMTGPTVQNGLTGGNANPVWRTWYDAYGRINRTQDPTGIESAMTYGGGSNPSFCLTTQVQGSQYPSGALTTTFTCDAVGNVVSTYMDGATTTAVYDNLRRKTQETGPSSTGIDTKWVFDLNGDQVEVRRWDSTAATWRTTTTTYSATHQPLTVTDPSGDLARTCYDLVDRPIMTIDPELRATRTVYNAAGQPTEIHRFQNAAAGACMATTQLPSDATFSETRWRRFEYNAGGLQSAEIDANGNRTEQVYDGLGRLARTVYANGRQEWTATDQRGQVVARKQPGGSLVSLFYDAIGRDFHVREFANGQQGYQWTGRNTRASYDLAGRPVYRDVSTQTTTTTTFDILQLRDVRNYTYNDALARLTSEQWRPEGAAGVSFTTGYGYGDGRGNRTSITQPGGWTINYTYDLTNRVKTVSFPGASGTRTVTISHDSLGRRTGVDRPGAAADTTYAYDVDNDLTGLTHAFVAGTGPGTTAFTYGHDAAGKVTSIGMNQPVFEWMPTLAYARTYGAADNMNRIGTVSDPTEARTLTWNDDGELSQEVRTKTGQGPVTWTYEWTYGHRLAGVTNNAPAAQLTATYSYDSDDRRTKTVVNGLMTRMLWSGTDELAQYDVTGSVVRRFIPDGAGGMDARLATVTPDGTVYWHHADYQGSVIATSREDGEVYATATYSLHGEGAPPTQSPFGYTGRQYDEETGLYYYRARYYSPYLGTFLSTDPIGTKADPNLYMYVGLDPANNVDPSGLAGCDASMSGSECKAAMRIQRHVLRAVRRERANLANLKSERAQVASGARRALSGRAQATQARLRDSFDSSTDDVISAVDSQLGRAQTFLEDAGSAAGGNFDYRAPTSSELKDYPSLSTALAYVNPGYRPNTVALMWDNLSSTSGLQILATFVHEPMHVMGVHPSNSIGEIYYSDATLFAKGSGGTSYAIYHNAENYACLVYPAACQ